MPWPRVGETLSEACEATEGTFLEVAASNCGRDGRGAMEQLATKAADADEGQLLAELRAGSSEAYAVEVGT